MTTVVWRKSYFSDRSKFKVFQEDPTLTIWKWLHFTQKKWNLWRTKDVTAATLSTTKICSWITKDTKDLRWFNFNLQPFTQNDCILKDAFEDVSRINSLQHKLVYKGFFQYVLLNTESLSTNFSIKKTINTILGRVYKRN